MTKADRIGALKSECGILNSIQTPEASTPEVRKSCFVLEFWLNSLRPMSKENKLTIQVSLIYALSKHINQQQVEYQHESKKGNVLLHGQNVVFIF